MDPAANEWLELSLMETLTQVVFPAMGNTVNLTVIGDNSLVDYARERIGELEHRWSRFIPSSDISRLNRSDGRPTPVHPDTLTLVRYLVDAQRLTAGLFDPTIAPALNGLGYSISRSDPARQCDLSGDSQSHIDLSSTKLDENFGAISLPHHATLDPGGLGKGLAADLVAAELINRGATGACISIGGDIRCMGTGPLDGHWLIEVAHPLDPPRIVGSILLDDGAVATSSVYAKRWNDGNIERHHVIEPATSAPLQLSNDSIVQSSVIASEAVWAEVFATVSLVGQTSALDHDLACCTVRSNGSTHANSQWRKFAHE